MFDISLNEVLVHEGGYYDGSKPHDPNPTYKGVTQKTYDDFRKRLKKLPLRPVRQMSNDECAEIYYKMYWLEGRCDLLPPGVNLMHFDFCVNAGIGRAARELQRVVRTVPDGIIGPLTLAKVNIYDPSKLVKEYAAARRTFYRKLAAPVKSKHKPSLRGWLKRVDAVERKATELIKRNSNPATS